jgi:transposase-like protein
MDTMECAIRKQTRQHPAALRQQVLMAWELPCASMARVARSHGLDVHMVRDWRRHARS